MSDQIILGIESAIAGGSICLTSGGQTIGSWVGDHNVSKAEELLPNIDKLLRANNLSVEKLNRVVTSTGPGSFTGIKIGISTVLGLRASVNVTCQGMTVLKAMSLIAPGEETIIAVPVGRGAVCLQTFRSNKELSQPELCYDNELDGKLSSANFKLIVHGSLVDRFPTAIDAGFNLAFHLCRASDSPFASTDLCPLFVGQKSSNI